MKTRIPDFSRGLVWVVGDLMLDRYWHGLTSRISPEAPVPVVHVQDVEERPGGAGNVALNLVELGVATRLFALTGEDEAAQALRAGLEGAGVECRFLARATHPTVTKLRVLSRHQQLIRLDFETPFSVGDARALNETVIGEAALPPVMILSDYGKGALGAVEALIERARGEGCVVLVDPKGRDFSRYRGASCITPNLAEFEAVVGPCPEEADLVAKGRVLMEDLALQALLVTRGEHGMTLLRPHHPPLHLPTQAREVFDVTGAGDTVISVLAGALAAGEGWEEATALANLAAGIVVGKLGTAAVTVPELRRAVYALHDAVGGVVNEDQLMVAVADARAHGERIVMTNGCFDILHAGHVAYLEEARRLGDRLIVAVNDDASVRRLKGAGRPVNPLERRMAVLAGLASVDWVVPFSEDTPERLICRVCPDVLVKGGDYRPEEIAGGRCVREAGGVVRVLGFQDGCSTSAIIRSIRTQEEDS